MEKLKLCPFCGGEAVKYRRWGRYGWFGNVVCETCGAETKKVNLKNQDEHDENFWEQEDYVWLVHLWNRRVQNAEPDHKGVDQTQSGD